MTFSINTNTNTASLAALQTLRETNSDLTSTENAVSTGLKVSSASDDPAVYVIAQKMNSNIAGLSAVSTGLTTGAQVVSSATSALSSIGSALSNIQSLISEGQNAAIDPTTINAQISNLLQNIDQYAAGATYSGVNLIAGSTGNGVNATQLSLTTSADGVQSISVGSLNSASSTANNATSAGLGLTGLSTTTSGVTLAGFVGSADGNTATTGTGTAADITLANNVGTASATSANPAQTWEFKVDTDGASGSSSAASVAASDANGNATSIANTITVHVATGATQDQVTAALQAAMKSAGFDASLDSSTGDLNVAGNNVATTGSSITTAPGGTSTVGSWTGAAAPVASVQAAIDKVGTMETTLGAATQQITGLQNYNSTLSDNMTTGVGALVDADLSEESAKLTSLQTKQQLAIQSLSMANSQSQSILSLFR